MTIFPRIDELRNLVADSAPPEPFFFCFEDSLRAIPQKKKQMEDLEHRLQGLDKAAWTILKKKLEPYLKRKHPTRGWQQLFDTMNEASGYNFLVGLGCTCIEFIPEEDKRTPDLRAYDHSGLVICEVKTLNISDVEIGRRNQGNVFTNTIYVAQKFLEKIASALDEGVDQIYAYLEGRPGRKIIFMVINFDDSLHEYAEDYRDQILNFLCDRQPAEIEVQLDISPPFYAAKIS